MSEAGGQKGPQFEVVQPVVEVGSEQGTETVAEQGRTSGEGAVSHRDPMTLIDDIHAQQQAVPVVAQAVTPVAPAGTTVQPEEKSDTVTKIAVDQAKNVIAKTMDDPFARNHEMSKTKAAYIKQRFNKTVKTDDTASS
jgi:hypothetical protein